MKLPLLLFSVFIARANSLYQLPSCDADDCNGNEQSAKDFVDSLNNLFTEARSQAQLTKFEYITNMTDENAKIMKEKEFNLQKMIKKNAAKLKKFSWDQFTDKDLVRRATIYYKKGENIPEEIIRKQGELKTRLQTHFSEAAVCKFADRNVHKCSKDFQMFPNIADVMRISKNHEELLYYWTEWRKNTGDQLRNDYIDFIKIENDAAKSVGFKDLKEKWLQPYEVYDFPSLVRNAYTKKFHIRQEHLSLEDLYKELHTYVKGKLIEAYKGQNVVIENDGMIPAHLLGEMWGTYWYLIDLVRPFSAGQAINITQGLLRNNYTAEEIYRDAEDIFVNLGFEAMSKKFWDYSMFVKPDDGRSVDCHGIVMDINPPEKDFRSAVCTRITSNDFKLIHYDMGNLVFNMQYRKQSFEYRQAPNPGIELAIGDLAGLAATTPAHLEELCLLEPEKNTQNGFVKLQDGTRYLHKDINYLMDVALLKIVTLPYNLLMDTWRWNFFSGQTNETNLNDDYWKLRNEIQGIKEPVSRDETNLDPAAVFHVPNHYPFIGFYVSVITQFQFYEALCKRSEEYDPTDENGRLLHLCDYSVGGEYTGEALRNMMSKGYSQHWNISMEEVTGSPELSGESMLKYFFPLYRFLKEENENSGVTHWK